jgi:hypothetical protein
MASLPTESRLLLQSMSCRQSVIIQALASLTMSTSVLSETEGRPASAYGFFWSSEVAKAAATGTRPAIGSGPRNPQILNLEP